MKVVLISLQYLGNITGSGGLYALELSRELAVRNYDITVLTFGLKNAKAKEEITLDMPELYKNISNARIGKKNCKVKVRRFWSHDSKFIKSPFEGSKDKEIKRLQEFNKKVLKYLDKNVKEKCLILLNGHFMVPSLAKELKKINRFRIVTSIHTLESISEARKGKDGATRKLINYIQNKEKEALLFSHYVILWSISLKEEISWIFPDIYKKINIKVIPFGVPSGFIDKTHLNDEKIQFLKERYNISDNFIFNLNRIDPSKGIEYLILAFPMLIKKLRKHFNDRSFNCSLLIAGFLEDKNLWYYNRLKKLINEIRDKDIKKNIQICTDSSVFNDKQYLHKMAKVFVIPSIVSPFGMSLIEAIIKEEPFVTSGIEGILDILNITDVEIPFSIVPGGTVINFLNPLTRVDYLADALFYVFTNYDRVKSSINKLQEKIIAKYSWNKTIEQNIAIYKKVEN